MKFTLIKEEVLGVGGDRMEVQSQRSLKISLISWRTPEETCLKGQLVEGNFSSSSLSFSSSSSALSPPLRLSLSQLLVIKTRGHMKGGQELLPYIPTHTPSDHIPPLYVCLQTTNPLVTLLSALSSDRRLAFIPSLRELWVTQSTGGLRRDVHPQKPEQSSERAGGAVGSQRDFCPLLAEAQTQTTSTPKNAVKELKLLTSTVQLSPTLQTFLASFGS